jgi:hypothetical protein
MKEQSHVSFSNLDVEVPESPVLADLTGRNSIMEGEFVNSGNAESSDDFKVNSPVKGQVSAENNTEPAATAGPVGGVPTLKEDKVELEPCLDVKLPPLKPGLLRELGETLKKAKTPATSALGEALLALANGGKVVDQVSSSMVNAFLAKLKSLNTGAKDRASTRKDAYNLEYIRAFLLQRYKSLVS